MGDPTAEPGAGAGATSRLKARPRKPAPILAAGEQQPVLLEAVNLSKRFGGIAATNGVSFELRQGEILGFIGPNGAGKTTLFDLLSGFLTADDGSIFLLGDDVTSLTPDARARRGLGRSFQDARLFPALTVRDAIAVALERQIDVRDPIAAALNLPVVTESEQAVSDRVDELVDLMGIGAFADKFVSELSTGSRRIVDLACILAHEPKVIMFDEPSSGIAQRETEALGPLLTRIQQETGCGMLVIEHDMPLITGISDEIVALELGAVVTRGLPAEVLADERVISAYLGGDIDVIQRSGART
jgi:branched-chain amino acid transport system ATP-binding protein